MEVSSSVLMGLTLLIVAYAGFGSLRKSETDNFFSKKESGALRGFWCLVIMLVHVPSTYQNPLQDFVGSFAYVGVTFFFMTSSYGLQIALKERGRASLDCFWFRRLPRLLIPCIFVNIFTLCEKSAVGEPWSPFSLIRIDNWVVWLILCYLAFWSVNRYLKFGRFASDALVMFIVIVLSLTSYIIGDASPIYHWPTEIWGFVWGIALANHRDRVRNAIYNKGFIPLLITLVISVALGAVYLKYKTVALLGDYVLKIALGLSLIILMLIFDVIFTVAGRLNSWLGSISYEVYLVHGSIFALVSTLAGEGRLSSGGFIFVSLVATVIIASAIRGAVANLLAMPARLSTEAHADSVR